MTTELNWLESRHGHSRYATEPEESVWLCDKCGEEHDPDDGPCPCDEQE